MEGDSPSDVIVLRDAMTHAVRFAYDHSLTLVGVSIVWFLTALPIITFGPATFGAYRVVIGIREPEPLDIRSVLSDVRRQFVHAVLLGLLPVAFWGIALFYAVQFDITADVLTLVMFLAAFYIGLYLAMLFIPAFVALAHGHRGYDAISFGRSWLSGHTTLALTIMFVTAILAALLLTLTIAFPAFFGGVAAAFHVEAVDAAYDEWSVDDTDQIDGTNSREIQSVCILACLRYSFELAYEIH